MFLMDPGLSDWGFRVGSATSSHQVSVYSMRTVLARFASTNDFRFICKIDIEGGEAELFKKDFDWMTAFPLIIIELHDWLLPGERTSRNFLRAVAEFNFDFVYRSENVFCFNNELLRSLNS